MSYGGYGGSGYGQGNPYDQRGDNNYGQQSNPYGQQSNPYGQQQSNPYGQQQSNPYGQQANPYGQQSNPYDQRQDDSYDRPQQSRPQQSRPQQDSYASNPYAQQSSGPSPNQGGYGRPANGQDMEMSQMGGGDIKPYERDILSRLTQFNKKLDNMTERFGYIERLQEQYKNSPDPTQPDQRGGSIASTRDSEVNSVKAELKQLKSEISGIEKTEGSAGKNCKPQVLRSHDRLKQTVQQFQRIEYSFQKSNEENMKRQIKIVNPNLSEQELNQAVSDSTGNVFANQLLQSGRQGQARSVQRAVQARHEEIQKIAQQVAELAQLFEQLNEQVVLQEVKVEAIDTAAEETKTHLDEGNQQLTTAVKSARAARKKKWICLGICVLIVVIIAVIVAIYFLVIKKNN